MDWYSITKFLHIVFAIGWLGGGIALIMLGARAERTRDDAELVRTVRNMLYLAERLFVPGAALALVFGVIAAWLASFFWQAWIVLGLVGFAITFTIGVAILKPAGERVADRADRDGLTPGVVAQCKRILRIAKFDYVMLFTIAFAMVFKPTSEDWGMIAAIVFVVLAGAAKFLRGALAPQPATA